ncbi:LysM peptidoglycan-binding domain-containing protein [Bacillus timonensis]|nr:LysM peptidoglycan-binding domain-containing protein [Bacillus timonensis]
MENNQNFDQANQLREKMNVMKNNQVEELPPRSDVHKEKKQKTKIKIKYPLIRILVLFFVLLPVTFYGYLYHKSEKESFSLNTETVKTNFEMIKFANEDSEIEDSNVSEENSENLDDASQEQPEQKINESNPHPKEQDTTTTKEQTTKTSEEKVETKPINSKEDEEVTYNIIYHKVKADENLFRISLKYFKDRSGEQIIINENNLKGNQVYEGQVLRIPIQNNK